MVGNVHLLAEIRFGRKPKLTLYQRKEVLSGLLMVSPS